MLSLQDVAFVAVAGTSACDETIYEWDECGASSDFSLKASPFQAGGAEVTSPHVLADTRITEITGLLKNPSSVSGTCVLKWYSSGGVLKATSDTVNNSSIGGDYESVTFTIDIEQTATNDYFLVTTDTGTSMRIKMSTESCESNTNAVEDKGAGVSDLPDYDWIGTATYCA